MHNGCMGRFRRNATVLVTSATLIFGFMTPAQAWDVESEIDDFGASLVIASTYFMPGVGNTDSFDEAYDNGDYQRLIIRCQDATLEVYMANLNEKFGTSRTALVKFGNSASKKWPISISTSKQSIFFANARTLATTIAKNKKFYVRADSTTGYLTANFEISGLSEYKTEFKKAGCKF